jgi:hypothetical protein
MIAFSTFGFLLGLISNFAPFLGVCFKKLPRTSVKAGGFSDGQLAVVESINTFFKALSHQAAQGE